MQKVVLCLFALVFLQTPWFGNGMLNMTLLTDPPGPQFSAATWIRFACKVHPHSAPETLTYQWFGSCRETSETVITVDDPLLDENGYAVIWLQSTPDYCQDYLECRARDMEGNDGLIGAMIENVSGVGMSIPTKTLSTLPNNSVVIVDSDTVNIVCHSASKTDCSGQWETPSGENIQQTDCDSLTFSFVDLPFDAGAGVYTCIIPDEDGVNQILLLGLYESSHLDNAQTSIVSLEITALNDILTLECLTEGLPPTAALWSINSLQLEFNDNVTYTKSQNVIDKTRLLYRSELSIPTNLGDEIGTFYTCNIVSDWMYTSEPKEGSTYATGHFVVIELGDVPVLPCKFPSNVLGVEWLAGNDVIANSLASNIATLVLNPTDVLGNVNYVCRGTTDKGFLEQHFRVLVHVPENSIKIHLSLNDSEANKTLGEPYYVQCCSSVQVTIPGIGCNPVVRWHYPDGSLASIDSQSVAIENETCTTLTITELTVFHTGNYTCEALVDYAFFSHPLSVNDVYILEVEGGNEHHDSTENDGEQHLIIAIIAPITAAMMLLVIILLLSSVLFIMQSLLKKSSQKLAKKYLNE